MFWNMNTQTYVWMDFVFQYLQRFLYDINKRYIIQSYVFTKAYAQEIVYYPFAIQGSPPNPFQMPDECHIISIDIYRAKSRQNDTQRATQVMGNTGDKTVYLVKQASFGDVVSIQI